MEVRQPQYHFQLGQQPHPDHLPGRHSRRSRADAVEQQGVPLWRVQEEVQGHLDVQDLHPAVSHNANMPGHVLGLPERLPGKHTFHPRHRHRVCDVQHHQPALQRRAPELPGLLLPCDHARHPPDDKLLPQHEK